MRACRHAPLLASIVLAGCIPQGRQPYSPEEPPPPPAYQRPPPEAGVEAPPTAAPAWQSRPVTPDARSVAPGSYVVQRGDTLRLIGDRTGAGAEAIARANALPPPFVIHAGERLAIPGGRYHLVRAGETGIAIARAYGIDWSRIVTANALSEPYILRVGQHVLIPDNAPGRSTAAERAAAFSLDVDDLVTGSQPAIADNQQPAAPTASPNRVLASTVPIAEPARLRGGFSWPLDGKIVAHFGPTGESGEKFNGIKIAAPIDTPVKAAADGVVAYAGSEIPSLGGLVMLRNGDSWTTIYGHCSQLLVQRGQSVKRGQVIAMSGDSGFADRPELHFEMRKGRTPVDPLAELPR